MRAKTIQPSKIIQKKKEEKSHGKLQNFITHLGKLKRKNKKFIIFFSHFPQAVLFRVFQEVFGVAKDAHSDELRRLGVFVIRKFVEIAPTNPKIFAELLFYKNIKDANELETGYCDSYDR